MGKKIFNVYDDDELGLQIFVISDNESEARNEAFRYFNSSGFLDDGELTEFKPDDLRASILTAGTRLYDEEGQYSGFMVTGDGDVETDVLPGILHLDELETELKKQNRHKHFDHVEQYEVITEPLTGWKSADKPQYFDDEEKALDFVGQLLACSGPYDITLNKLVDNERVKTCLYHTAISFPDESIHRSLNEIAQEVHQTAREHGWWASPRTFGELIALCHSELSEALEEHRNDKAPRQVYYVPGSVKPEGIPIELADTVIRIMDMCAYYSIDLETAIREKMAYNKTRPYLHGGKKL